MLAEAPPGGGRSPGLAFLATIHRRSTMDTSLQRDKTTEGSGGCRCEVGSTPATVSSKWTDLAPIGRNFSVGATYPSEIRWPAR